MNLNNLDPVRMEAMIAEQKTVGEDADQARDLRRKRIWFNLLLLAVLLGLLALALSVL